MPGVELINSTREYLADFCKDLTGDAELTSCVALAAHELLENVLKYSSDGVAVLDVGLLQQHAGQVLRMKIRNRSEGTSIAELRRRIGELQAPNSPTSVYYRLLGVVDSESDESGLGLARICAEADMSLTCEVDGDEVTVVAERPLEPRIAA
jgi:hypothetical protein